MIKDILLLLSLLPELIKLIKNIQKRIEKQKTEREVREDIIMLNRAFEEKDAKKINDILNV